MVEGYEWVFILVAAGTGLGLLIAIHETWVVVKARRAHGTLSDAWTKGPRRAPVHVQGSVRHRQRAVRSRRP